LIFKNMMNLKENMIQLMEEEYKKVREEELK
jgi:hypothetical protein